jgi:hypothetical protein
MMVAATTLPVTAQQDRIAPEAAVKKIRLQLQLGGLYPSSLTVPEGTYEVIVSNTAFLGPIDISVQNASQRVAQSDSKGKAHSRRNVRMELKVGRYQVSVVGQPKWVVDLTVVPGAPK